MLTASLKERGLSSGCIGQGFTLAALMLFGREEVIQSAVPHYKIDALLRREDTDKPHTFGPLYPGKFEPFPKNPNMAKFFAQIGRAEELGTGIRKVFHYIKAYSGSERVEFLDEDLFVVKVPLVEAPVGSIVGINVEGSQKTVEKAVEKTVEKILSLIMLNPRITQQELIDKTSLTRRGVEWNLKKLKASGRIRRIGPDKGGHWEVST